MSSIPRNIDFDRKEGGFRFYLLSLDLPSTELSSQNLPIEERHFYFRINVFLNVFFSLLRQ